MNEEEIWKPIPGYPNHKISSLGRVKGPRAALLKPCYIQGRPKVCLSIKSICKTYFIHSLVALAFLGPCPEDLEVDHINGIKSDNRSINLRYVTRLENIRSARNLGLFDRAVMKGAKNPAAKLTQEQVIEIKNSIEQTARLAAKFSVARSTIRRIRSRASWTHLE